MNIFHAVTTGFNFNAKKFANIFKPLKCPCCCCNRPVIHINLGENDTPIGKIIHSFSFCDPEFQVFKPNGDLKYFVHADCCQCGIVVKHKRRILKIYVENIHLLIFIYMMQEQII